MLPLQKLYFISGKIRCLISSFLHGCILFAVQTFLGIAQEKYFPSRTQLRFWTHIEILKSTSCVPTVKFYLAEPQNYEMNITVLLCYFYGFLHSKSENVSVFSFFSLAISFICVIRSIFAQAPIAKSAFSC